MRFSSIALSAAFFLEASTSVHGFAPVQGPASTTALMGYLDDLSSELHAPDANPIPDEESREHNQMAKEDIVSAGPGSWDDYVEFNEFDGGDGQMGVAGDGSTGLDKSEFQTGEITNSVASSRARSAKNAWGSDTGYADDLRKKGVDTARAQQLENWNSQQEIKNKRDAQKYMTEQFDSVQSTAEEDWRKLSKFGIERNTDTDLNEEFGAVSAEGVNLEGTIELSARPGTMTGGIGYHEFSLSNPYMGFSDFRASFTPETSASWSVDPMEGSLQKQPTQFQVKFRPEGPGVFEGFLVVETEDFKKVWKVIGSTNS